MGVPEPSGDLQSTGSSKMNIGPSGNLGCKPVSSGGLRRVQEHLGKARRAKECQGGPGGRLKTQKKMFTTSFEPTT